MASMPQQTHASFPSRPYSSTLAHHNKLPPTNTSRDHNRLERERGSQAQVSSTNALNNITDEQREEINEAFSLFDLDKDGRIDYHEFKVALKALGFDLPKPSILNLLTTHGSPPTQATGHAKNPNSSPPARLLLTLPAFQNIAAKLISERDPRDEILRAFALFDADDKGIISLDDLRRVARELGEGLEEEELAAMIEEFDLDGKGGAINASSIKIPNHATLQVVAKFSGGETHSAPGLTILPQAVATNH
ncbi:BgTH12-05556 [Blumeria graminis f. sp. triticale]|uniref:Bgt-4706 n=3 Tax=Blumeria graminis TaxID=34373 RepID=A0A381L4K2_BLUGR|nr:Calcium-binding component of the spindle pole body [Blumeria graminis f. sp. tritici 96224]CAD6503811.1 BgTH12-05556 [Blumeria graminis f. sp. triticale]VDB90445.1 Bgt-4706 [Blumeria graminis f. sp. tritici]